MAVCEIENIINAKLLSMIHDKVSPQVETVHCAFSFQSTVTVQHACKGAGKWKLHRQFLLKWNCEHHFIDQWMNESIMCF